MEVLLHSNGKPLPGRAALLYAVGATVWIALSDTLLNEWLVGTSTRWATLKGLAFVGVTSVMLYGLLRHVLRRAEKAEHALRDQERRWQFALEAVGDGVWDYNLRTGQCYYSPKWKAMLGYADNEIISDISAWKELIHPEDRERVEQMSRDYLEGRAASYDCEFRMRRRDGSYRWVRSRGRFIDVDEHGQPTRIIGTHSDVDVRRRALEELEESARRYRELFEANPNPMWVFDGRTLRILAVNDVAVQKYGYSHQQFKGMTIRDLQPSEDAPALAETVPQDRESAQRSGPWRHRLADGRIITVEVTSHALHWQGRAARAVLVHDITEQDAVRRAVEESAQRFRAVFESARDAIFIADAHGFISDCNPSALELFRATPGQMLGHRVPEFFPPTQPDGSDSLARARAVLREMRSRPMGAIEWTNLRPDGTCFVGEITISPLRYQGREETVIVVRDLTDRHRASQQLQLLHAALRAAPTGWVITDHQGRIEWVNPAFTTLTGYTAEEALGQTPRLLKSGQQPPELYAEMWGTIRRGEVWRGDLRNRRKDGSTYDEHMVIAPVCNAVGTITHFVAMKHDITAERRLEQQLARAQRLESVGMLASGIAHDLNNVLTPIILSVELLKSSNALPHGHDRLDLVAQAAQRGANIVKQVLTFARGVDGERTVVQPRYLVKEVAQLAEETFPRSIEVRVETGRDISTVLGDVTQLHQVLLNLAVNARDAMPQGGRLVLGVRNVMVDAARAQVVGRIEPGPFVEFSVADTGTGITDEVLEHIFEPFYTTKPRGKGTGLGLSTVYGIVRSHGGGVDVQTQLGRGTTFRVLLPVPPDSAPASAAPAELAGIQGEGRLVLLVDDEEPIRVVGEHVLRRFGFKVVAAADGLQALQLFRLRPQEFSLALVDQMMPRMSGVELIRELRKLRPDLRIISSTGLSGEPGAEQSDAEELMALGIRTRLPKPYTSAELQEALRRELAGS
jgi:two-component system cell cycle sensor histidine kinase/response regulator CckA